MYRNLVLSGGSIKGLGAFIGCIKYLEDNKMLPQINTLIGSSAGAIVCFMICCGMSSSDMINFLSKEVSRYNEYEFDVTQLFNFLSSVGVDDGAFIMQTFLSILQTKFRDLDDITFIDFAKTCGRNLVVCGSNLTKVTTDFFSVDTTPNMSILHALRISISLPFIFTPVIHNGNVYSDAALFNNFPINYMDSELLKLTLGICIKHNERAVDHKELDLMQYLGILVNAAFYKMNEKKSSPVHDVVTVHFDDDNPYNFDLASFKFVVSTDLLLQYAEKGFQSTSAYIRDRPVNPFVSLD